MTTPNNPIVNAGLLYINGLSIANTGIDAKTIFVFPGASRDSANIGDIILNSNLIINGAGTGANGSDVAVLVANSFYAVYIIGDSTDNKPTAGLFSLSISNPFLPVGYDMFRRIGWILTDSSANIVSFTQSGIDQRKTYYYLAPITVLTGGTSTLFTNVNISSAIPSIITQTGIRVTNEVFLNVNYTPALAANHAQFQNIVSSSFPNGIVQFGGGSTTTQFGTIMIPSNLRQIAYKVVSGDSVTLSITGYTDYLY